ncbi:aminotransferase class I/II-fold pyridoxal phosphate-dependent enzyme [Streptomyces roseolilacinus]|uniref:8-amino-7-oxononanoate synthase n=1 Tax=Streptomyces roseolilacinus TaxID=66904 RepID=A0A918EM08_9ACTN|nr:aminotransferase class I/II-fold pyridoxal phosphate-dependent enzyme [Streptomyces roseolilacinus]GGQ08114.1 2-amino-3-ketobutyrate CoA ligase [Streptomyces roseolilacinus]
MHLGPALTSTLDLIDRWRKEDTYPFFPVVSEAAATRAVIRSGRQDAGSRAEQRVTVLASADYLGIGHHPDVLRGATDAVRRFGTNTYGTQAVGGFTVLHHALEEAVAAHFARPAALLFPTGMQANLGVLATLAGPGDTVLSDQFSHGSIVMGARLSGADTRTFRHNDAEHLDRLLADVTTGRRLVVVDGLYSAHGDLAPLADLAEVAERHDALLVVDEAHSGGALGENGRGAAELLAVEDRVHVVTGTFSKAFASTGGFVCAGERVIDALRHSAGAYLLSLGLPPATVGAALAAVGVVRREGADRRAALARNARTLRSLLHRAHVDTADSAAHVVVVPTGLVDRTARIARALARQGLLVTPLLPPAVPIGAARLRLGVTAGHTDEDLALAARLVAAALAHDPR